MSRGDWFDDYEMQARLEGDEPRIRMGDAHREAYVYRESDPDRALALIAEGRRIAEQLQEPWWVLYYDQQRVHALLHFKQDYRNVLDLAIRNTLELRKPGFAGFPRHNMIHGDLVSTYLGIDPLGYEEPIQQALDYLESQTPVTGNERYLLLGSRRQFALERGDLDEAERCCLASLSLAAEDISASRTRHFLVFNYNAQAEIAFRRGDLECLREAALEGERLARSVGHQVELAGFRLWLAYLARHEGDEQQASRLFRQARARLNHLGMPPDSSYRDAECAFHQLGGDLSLAVEVRDQELRSLRDRGRFAYEATCLVKRAWLLRQLGSLTHEDLALARLAASRLRRPARILEQIARIEQGESP